MKIFKIITFITLLSITNFLSPKISEAKVIYETGNPNILITSSDSVKSERNKILKWTWVSTKNTADVDIYLVSKNKKHSFAKKYPNTGNFEWAVGFGFDNLKIKNGNYSIAVCPAGNKKIDAACDYFSLEIYGNSPEIKIIKPKGGNKFKKGDEISVIFNGAQVGDSYKVSLLYPAKASPIATVLGKRTAENSGKEQFDFVIPEEIKNGVYTLEIIQETNNGATCVNVCAITESKRIKIK